ncbi:transposase [Polaribacter batillariae]|uniref:Transposase n=2 Tax=Polaribacter batillariae TaxID=2808900 RepID=A0ABX7SYF6_9FLAO|nr:transposase [Polaribacter batillariae]
MKTSKKSVVGLAKVSTQLNGGKQKNKQRYKCNSCSILFTFHNQSVQESNRFIWFEKWIIKRRTIQEISKESGYSVRTLKRYFDNYLSKPPRLSVYPSEKVNLLIDATYFSNGICLVLYRDATIKFTQLYRLTNGEHYLEIKEDLENLLALGVQIESITSDGHKSILKAVKKVIPNVILQRCLVHIQRDCRIWLTKHPKSFAGQDLKKITSEMHLITSHFQLSFWLLKLHNWYEKYKGYINEKSYNLETGRYWYTHKMVRRSFMSIKRALPNMFHYLDNPRIPKSTNSIESFFGHMKGHLNIHRGLSYTHRKQYIMWYLYFKNKT